MLISLAAFALAIAGIGCLYASWQDQLPARLRPTLVGWLLLIAAGYCAVRAGGAEFGTTLICLAPALVAWILVAINAELREAKVRKRSASTQAESTAPVASRSLRRHLLLFFITVPLSAISATFLSIALSRLLPWTDLSQMALAIFLMPFLWGCAAYWAAADSKLLRPTLIIIGLGVSCAVTALM